MSDDKSKRGGSDRTHINVHVGTVATDVEAHLKKH